MVQIDIQMPSDCYSCWVRKNMGCKIANDSGWLNNKRDDNCPLKEQEAVKPEREHSGGGTTWWNVCGNCKTAINPNDKFCHECGKAVKWNA